MAKILVESKRKAIDTNNNTAVARFTILLSVTIHRLQKTITAPVLWAGAV